MKALLKYWYIIVAAIVLNVGAAIGVLYYRQAEWMPKPLSDEELKQQVSALANMSSEYLDWNYGLVQMEAMQTKLEAEREALSQERVGLEALRQQQASELAELIKLRDEIDALRQSVDEEFLKIEESEISNLKRLAKVYSEMKPVPVVELFKQMDLGLIVKIMSLVTDEAAAKILAEMTKEDQSPGVLKQAVLITEKLRQIRK